MPPKKKNPRDAHQKGVKLDAEKPRVCLLLEDFPRAVMQVGVIATHGADKYTDHGWKTVEDGERRYTSALLRHLLLEGIEGETDRESDELHAAHVAWNALARLELLLLRKGV